jgi:hypothetical protein
VDPVPDPLLLRKSGSGGNRTRDLWVSSQELLSLDHRGGPLLHTKHLKLPDEGSTEEAVGTVCTQHM